MRQLGECAIVSAHTRRIVASSHRLRRSFSHTPYTTCRLVQQLHSNRTTASSTRTAQKPNLLLGVLPGKPPRGVAEAALPGVPTPATFGVEATLLAALTRSAFSASACANSSFRRISAFDSEVKAVRGASQ